MGKSADLLKVGTSLLMGVRAAEAGDVPNALTQFAAAGGYGAFYLAKYHGTKAMQTAMKGEAWVLETCIATVSVLELMMGAGSEKGDKFTIASKDFSLAIRTLEDAAVDDRSWTGSAAAAYDKQNTDQINRAEKMVGFDKEIAAILKAQAGQIKDAKAVLGQCKIALMGCIPPALLLYNIVPDGAILSYTFQCFVIQPVMIVVGLYFDKLMKAVDKNADAVNEVKAKYEAVAADAAAAISVLNSNTASSGVMTASTSTVGEFETLSAVPGTTVAGSDSAASAAVSSSSDARLFASTAATSDADTPEADMPVDVPDEQTPETPVPPAFTMPTPSEMVSRASQASTQAAKFSEEAAVHVSLVNDIVGTVDQISSMAQSAAPPAVPADEAQATEDAVANGDDVEGAAAGTTDAEPAPIDSAADGVQEAQEANPVQRVL